MSQITINDILTEIKKIEIRLARLKVEIRSAKLDPIDSSFDFDCGQKLKDMEVNGFIAPSSLKQEFGHAGIRVAKEHGYVSQVYWDADIRKTCRAYTRDFKHTP